MSNFAKGLKQLRLERVLTQSELAKDLNVTQNAIYNWENEKREPNLDMIEKIADYFDTTLLYLLEGKEEYKNRGDIKTAESTAMENAIKTAPRIYVREDDEKSVDHPITKKTIKFTTASRSHAQTEAYDLFHSLLSEDWIMSQEQEVTAVQLKKILGAYDRLNTSGRKEAVKRVDELTELSRYTTPDEPQS